MFSGTDPLRAIIRAKRSRSARISSWDHTGEKANSWMIGPGEKAVLAELEGPGAIINVRFDQSCSKIVDVPRVREDGNLCEDDTDNSLESAWEVDDEDFYRNVIIKMYWDDQETPSVLAPLGDFFCVCNGMAANFQSVPFTVSVNPNQQYKFGGRASFNCYLRMPFNKKARIEVENQGDIPYTQYFYIDYEIYPEPPYPLDTLYFHAHWKRVNSARGWGPKVQIGSELVTEPNLNEEQNYILLETEGRGNYIGCNHTVIHDNDVQSREKGGVPRASVSCRWHLTDPIRFDQKIKVDLDEYDTDCSSNDWASTVYWYQTLPSPELTLQPAEERKPQICKTGTQPDSSCGEELTGIQEKFNKDNIEKLEAYKKKRAAFVAQKIKETRDHEKANIKFAREIREKYLASSSY